MTASTRHRWCGYLLVGALALAIHAWSLTFGFSRVDDDILVVDRATFLSDFRHVADVFSQGYFPLQHESPHYYRPLVTVSYMLDARTPLSAGPYHFTNVLLHIVASLLFLVLLRRRGFSDRVSIVVAALFAVHPVVTSTVDWIPGRNDSLLACFVFAAWLFFERWRERHSWMSLAAHVAFFLAALLTKETAAVVPVLWIVSGRVDRRGPVARRDGWLLGGWAAAFAIWLGLRSTAPEQPAPAGDRLAAVWHHLPALLVHLGKLFVPVQLSVLANGQDSSPAPGLLAVALVVAVMVTSRDRLRTAFGAFVFLLLVGPSLMAPNDLLLENRLYLPLAGALLMVAAWLESRTVGQPAFVAISAGLVAVLAVRTLVHSADYSTPLAFGEDCVRTAPSLSLSHMTAGNALVASGDPAGAEREFRRALEIGSNNGIAHNNLGVLAMRRHDLAVAEREIRAGLAVDPSYAKGHFNLGLTLQSLGRGREAAAELTRAAELDPDSVDAVGELFATYSQLGDVENAQRTRGRLEKFGVQLLDSAKAPSEQ